jgi:hypothetical protein
MSPDTRRASRKRRVARWALSPTRATRSTHRTIHMTATTMRTTRSRIHRSDAMYLLNEAMARARCAEQKTRGASRPAREVAMEAARTRRESR